MGYLGCGWKCLSWAPGGKAHYLHLFTKKYWPPQSHLEMSEGGALRVDPHTEGTSHTTLHGKVMCAGATSAPAMGDHMSSADNLNELVAQTQGEAPSC